MEPIKFDGTSWKIVDISGNIRWAGKVNGKNVYRSRLTMMNYLHTKHLPKWLHVHHGSAGTECDEIWNLSLLSPSKHAKLHHPATFPTSYEYEKNRRLNPDVQAAIRANSLKWYHKNKNKVNNNKDKKNYKRDWYLKNKSKILVKLSNRYNHDEEYRNKCLMKAKNQKLTNKLLKKELCG